MIAAAGLIASPLAAPASADSSLAAGVRVQCSGFSGPNTVWPHYLTGCVSQDGTSGTGQTNRTGPGTETITWDAPFLDGENMDLVGIANSPVNVTTPVCPAEQPSEVDVPGLIGPGSSWEGSSVAATICAGASGFNLKPGTFFVISEA
ncbi:hypothetical protein [Streptomyces sp. NPDC088812]|uniref:hypothetical protein n=1 Tax=Streptomyces sp. NPDC088812 TaxID=3365905 RepID=UPI0037F366D0